MCVATFFSALPALFGWALLATWLLAWPLRLRRAGRAGVLVAVFACGLLPVGGVPLLGYLRGVGGDLSVPFLAVIGAAALDLRLPGRSQGALLGGALVAGVALYPAAFGWGPIDPYGWGFGSPWLPAGLLGVAAWWWFRARRAAAIVLCAAALACQLGLFESRNLWDYCLDPLLALAGLGWLVRRPLRRRALRDPAS